MHGLVAALGNELVRSFPKTALATRVSSFLFLSFTRQFSCGSQTLPCSKIPQYESRCDEAADLLRGYMR